METIKFTATVGTTSGYGHNNENNNMDFVGVLKECCAEQEKESGVYVSFVISPSKCIYKEEWGCPPDGEDTMTISSTMNPKFIIKPSEWKKACIGICEKLMSKLNQSTITAEFCNIDYMIYLQKQ